MTDGVGEKSSGRRVGRGVRRMGRGVRRMGRGVRRKGRVVGDEKTKECIERDVVKGEERLNMAHRSSGVNRTQ